jgi:hypothetical protein
MLVLGSALQANAQLQVVVPDVMTFADQQITITAADKDSIQKWANVLVRNNKFLRKYSSPLQRVVVISRFNYKFQRSIIRLILVV